MRQQLRVYVDTSVFGAAFADGFADASNGLLDEIRRGRLRLLTSSIVRDEVAGVPEHVRELFREMLAFAELVEPSEAALALRDAYLHAGVVTQKWAANALHVAIATTEGCAVLASWNFRHIVHFQKTPLYNAVNALNGYPSIAICAPAEVLDYGEE